MQKKDEIFDVSTLRNHEATNEVTQIIETRIHNIVIERPDGDYMAIKLKDANLA